MAASQPIDGFIVVELTGEENLADVLAGDAEVVAGNTFPAEEQLKAAGWVFVRVGRMAVWARPEVARQINRLVQLRSQPDAGGHVVRVVRWFGQTRPPECRREVADG
jgi:hypothetical protein